MMVMMMMIDDYCGDDDDDDDGGGGGAAAAGGGGDDDNDVAKACAIEMHTDISQEPCMCVWKFKGKMAKDTSGDIVVEIYRAWMIPPQLNTKL